MMYCGPTLFQMDTIISSTMFTCVTNEAIVCGSTS